MSTETEKEDRRAVIDGVLRYTSVTAVDRFAGCDTSYYFRYVEGIADPAGPAAQKGVEGHKRIQHYLETGEDVLGPVERAGLHFIPKPIPVGGPGLLIEKKVDGVLDANGTPFKGGMDLLDERQSPAVLTDWKFKSEIGTTEENLRNPHHSDGRQMLAYAETYFRMRPGADRVVLRHVHFGTKKRESDSWQTEVTREYVRQAWQLISDQYVTRLHAVASARSASETSTTGKETGHCYKFFKPCVYMDRCPVGGVDLMFLDREKVTTTKESPMGLLSSKMSSLTSSTSVSMPPVASSPPPMPSVSAPPLHSKKPRMLDVGAAYRLPGGITGRLEQIDGVEAQFIVSPTERAYYPLDAVGEQVAEAVALVQAPDTPLVPPAQKAEPLQATPAGEQAGAPLGIASVETQAAVPGEAPKRGRGRPKKDAAVSTVIVASQEVIESTPEVSAMTISVQNVKPEGVNLYFAGAPLGKSTSTLRAYVEGLEKCILEKLGEKVPDIRLGRHDALTFGRWKAVLEQAAKEAPPPPGHYVIGAEEKEYAVACALIPMASLAVMGR